MMVINNRCSDNNHQQTITYIFTEASEILIVSPFLSKNPEFFNWNNLHNLNKLTLITTLPENYSEQETKVAFFVKLCKLAKEKNIILEILIDEHLHAKIYIGRYATGTCRGIMPSANFTRNGLNKNNEWGVIIDDNELLTTIETDIRNNPDIRKLSQDKIDEYRKKIDQEKRSRPKDQKQGGYDLKLPNPEIQKIQSSNPVHTILPDTQFWLKPMGASNLLIDKNSKYGQGITRMHFAKKPRSIRQGDILVAYATGYRNVLSIFRVTSGIKEDPAVERWPHYVEGENMTPYYGSQWNQYDINISQLKDEVLNLGLFNITPSGKNNYRSLMRGADKLRITPEFGQYI